MSTSEKIKIILKVNKVIASCRTMEQLEVAKKYLELYRKKYPIEDRSYGILLHNVISLQKIFNDVH